MITPQAIKDQEFQLKFRGCDPIEVKSYLELLAEDFFELHEAQRKQTKEFEELNAELTGVRKERDSLKAEVALHRGSAESVQQKVEEGYRYKDECIAGLTSELETITEEKMKVVGELQQLENSISDLGKREESALRDLIVEREQTEKLTDKIAHLEENIVELKQEGVDFKSTILVAQKFSEELKENAQTEADALVAAAKLESEDCRALALQKMEDVSLQIESLIRTRNEVRDELKNKLEGVLSSIADLDLEHEIVDDLIDKEAFDNEGRQ